MSGRRSGNEARATWQRRCAKNGRTEEHRREKVLIGLWFELNSPFFLYLSSAR